MGIGMSVIAILLLIMGVFENILPAFFVYIALGIILADVVIIIVLGIQYVEGDKFRLVDFNNSEFLEQNIL